MPASSISRTSIASIKYKGDRFSRLDSDQSECNLRKSLNLAPIAPSWSRQLVNETSPFPLSSPRPVICPGKAIRCNDTRTSKFGEAEHVSRFLLSLFPARRRRIIGQAHSEAREFGPTAVCLCMLGGAAAAHKVTFTPLSSLAGNEPRQRKSKPALLPVRGIMEPVLLRIHIPY
jgi:hypothetical protein